MLIRITNRCQMVCSHCLTSAHPEGEHMTMDTFARALSLARMDPPVLLISGGEPTEHPKLLEMLGLAKGSKFKTVLLSNGEYFQKPKLAKIIESLVWGVQVTNDPRYYPRRVRVPKDMPVETCISSLSPFGRAQEAGMEPTRNSPFCFNLRSATRHYKHIGRAIIHLRGMQKMCTPSVNVDGTVVAGEAPQCAPIGTVDSTVEELTRGVMEIKCACGLVDKLDMRQREAVGV